MRVDRWLWTARPFKTRSLAAGAATGGRVRVNGVAVRPSREVGPGDRLEITIGPVRRTLIVRGAAERRVSAAEAARLYEETAESVAERERQRELRRLAGPVNLGGRPTKRDRRRFDAGRRWNVDSTTRACWVNPAASGWLPVVVRGASCLVPAPTSTAAIEWWVGRLAGVAGRRQTSHAARAGRRVGRSPS